MRNLNDIYIKNGRLSKKNTVCRFCSIKRVSWLQLSLQSLCQLVRARCRLSRTTYALETAYHLGGRHALYQCGHAHGIAGTSAHKLHVVYASLVVNLIVDELGACAVALKDVLLHNVYKCIQVSQVLNFLVFRSKEVKELHYPGYLLFIDEPRLMLRYSVLS